MATRSESVLVAAAATPDNQSQFELETASRWNEEPEHESLLPPTDGGKDAWLFLAAAFVIEIMVWGKFFPTHRPQRGFHHDVQILLDCLVDIAKAFHGHMVSSRSTTARPGHLPANLVSRPSEPQRWVYYIWWRPSHLDL